MPRPRKNPPAAPETTPVEPSVAAVPQPLPTSPAVLKIQESIVALLGERDQARAKVTNLSANLALHQAKVHAATSRVQSANGELVRIDNEIQYRAGLIASLEGRSAVTPAYSMDAATQQRLVALPIPGVSGQVVDIDADSDLINRGHASRAMI